MSLALDTRVLVMDFCGAEPLLALARGQALLSEERLPHRGAASGWLPALRRLLDAQGWGFGDLDAVGVVGGPGSFTGVRTGLAAAQGLCEAGSMRLAVVSSLAVLAQAAGEDCGLAALYAGRDQLYVRKQGGADQLVAMDALRRWSGGGAVAVSEARLLTLLPDTELRLVHLGPMDILSVVCEVLERGGTPMAAAEANYVRAEGDIYRKSSVASPLNPVPDR